MAIPEKNIDECTQVKVTICGESKLKVIEKQNELKAKGLPYAKSFAIEKLILGK